MAQRRGELEILVVSHEGKPIYATRDDVLTAVRGTWVSKAVAMPHANSKQRTSATHPAHQIH